MFHLGRSGGPGCILDRRLDNFDPGRDKPRRQFQHELESGALEVIEGQSAAVECPHTCIEVGQVLPEQKIE